MFIWHYYCWRKTSIEKLHMDFLLHTDLNKTININGNSYHFYYNRFRVYRFSFNIIEINIKRTGNITEGICGIELDSSFLASNWVMHKRLCD